MEPEFIVQECTANFDVVGFSELLKEKYLVQTCRFSPVELGIPTRRLRSYVLATKKSSINVKLMFCRASLQDHFFRKLSATGAIYFRLPENSLRCHLGQDVPGPDMPP
eukprot:13698742-Alexandrium_andersonii.AAC.1